MRLVLRSLLAVSLLLMSGVAAQPQGVLDPAEWQLYQSRFITAEGRVVDTGNAAISHSEGQGYGMLLAAAYRDPIRFERLWRWTRTHLQVRDDHLFAWKWDRRAVGGPVPDHNSAVDGDLLIAWALARAARLWRVDRYQAAAQAIARDIRAKLWRPHQGRALLLPGSTGFIHDRKVTVNLSYWVFPALADLGALDPEADWNGLGTLGLDLLKQARFGRERLPPDWLELTEPPRPSIRHAPVFGYNAIRIPLHLVWAGIDDAELLGPFVDYWRAYDQSPPATLDLITGDPSPEPISAGGQAIFLLARHALDGIDPDWPELSPAAPYFGASLLLLSKVAFAERFEP